MLRRTNYQQRQSSFRKKPTRPMSDRYLREELDAITSKIVRLQESVCFIIGCHKTFGLECGHLLERRHVWTRWDTAPNGNCHAQCPLHNQQHERDSSLYRESYIQRFGQQAYDDLVFRSRSKQKMGRIELEALLVEKEAQLAKLKGKAA